MVRSRTNDRSTMRLPTTVMRLVEPARSPSSTTCQTGMMAEAAGSSPEVAVVLSTEAFRGKESTSLRRERNSVVGISSRIGWLDLVVASDGCDVVTATPSFLSRKKMRRQNDDYVSSNGR